MERRTVLVAIVLIAFTWSAVPATGKGPPRADKPARAICAHTGGTFFGPNAVYGIDTSAFTDAGYFCRFDGPAAGGTFTYSAAAADPRTKRIKKLCAAGGSFYLFSRRIGPSESDTVFGGWGCQWLF